MDNRIIRKQLHLASQLMELHDENPFKAKSYESAAQIIENTINYPLSELNQDELENISGIGKKVASNIISIINEGSFDELLRLLSITPEGVVRMLNVKGIGPKKVKTLWKELHIESIYELLNACEQNKVAQLKGFGEKTQEKIIQVVKFTIENEGKFLYADVEEKSLEIEKLLKKIFTENNVSISGEMRRKSQIISSLDYLIIADFTTANDKINALPNLSQDEKKSAPFVWRGIEKESKIKVQIRFVPSDKFYNQLLIETSSDEHLEYVYEGKTLLNWASNLNVKSEEEIYTYIQKPYIEPIFREGTGEFDRTDFDDIIKFSDLKGCLHNHSKYSDGKNTIAEMAQKCIDMGYSYFGISDHSKSAFYANGLNEQQIEIQHKEIDELNKNYNNFKIFKGIESDILNDGNLDYDDAVLKTFDFIVASVHSNLSMDINKATQRLLRAIENPYTTMLGHPTGRLLLQREGYPINHKMIIEACARNKVIIELNANPWRLDIDWKWINYCMEKEVMISINPDAHELDGVRDMYYGTIVAQKGLLKKQMCFNAKTLKEVDEYFINIKKIKGV